MRRVWRAYRKLWRNRRGNATEHPQHDLRKKKPSSKNGAKKEMAVRKQMLRRAQVQKNRRSYSRQPKRTFLLGSPRRHILKFRILQTDLQSKLVVYFIHLSFQPAIYLTI